MATKGFPTHLPTDARTYARVLPITLGTTVLVDGPCRGFWVGTAGTLNFTDGHGNSISSFPAVAGLNPIVVATFSSGGTASGVYALY